MKRGNELAPPSTRASYGVDWNKILDGNPWEFTRGKDFDRDPHKFARAAVNAASKRGLKCAFKVDGVRVTIQAFD